jgi:hypothetical protein
MEAGHFEDLATQASRPLRATDPQPGPNRNQGRLLMLSDVVHLSGYASLSLPQSIVFPIKICGMQRSTNVCYSFTISSSHYMELPRPGHRIARYLFSLHFASEVLHILSSFYYPSCSIEARPFSFAVRTLYALSPLSDSPSHSFVPPPHIHSGITSVFNAGSKSTV